MLRSALAIVTVTAFLTACTSSTPIRSNPPGAKVFIDGSYVGTTPYEMSDTKIVGSSTSVRLEYPGYQPVAATIKRSEEFDVVACIGGVFLLVPFLWIMGYKPDHTYEMGQGGYGPPPPAYPPAQGYPPPQQGYPQQPPAQGYPPPQGYQQQPAPQPPR